MRCGSSSWAALALAAWAGCAAPAPDSSQTLLLRSQRFT